MPAGIGAGGYLAVIPEVTMGTYLDPATTGTVFVPIISESLAYTEDKYFSPQLAQTAVVRAVDQSFYHVEGDIVMEVDTQFLPYFLYASRHNITKTGTASPYTYVFTPSPAGSASSTAGANQRTLSITIVRNNVGFGYAGCTCQGYEFTVEDGVLRVTLHVLGLSETTPPGLGTPVWTAPKIMGADASSIILDAAGPAPTFAGGPDLTFNGYTLNINHNGTAQNRINSQRAANYIAFGETEVTIDTELDFLTKVEYDNFKAASRKAVRLEALGSGTWASTNDGVRLDVNDAAYTSYELGLSGIGDLIMAGTAMRGIHPAGGSAYTISVKSTLSVT
jgi:hypothetical protein